MHFRLLCVVLCIVFCAVAVIILRETTGFLGAAGSEGAEKSSGTEVSAARVSEGAEVSAARVSAARVSAEAKLELDRGLEFRKQNRFDTAIEIFRRALKKDLSDDWASEFLFEIGQTQYQIGKHEIDGGATVKEAEPALHQALATFDAVIKKYPASKRAASSSHMTGSTHMVLEQPERALKAYESTFNRYPNYVGRSRSLVRSGMVLVVLDRIPEGVAVYNRVIRDFAQRNGDVQVAKKYRSQLEIVGQKATLLRPHSWLNNLVDESDLASFEGEVIVLVFLATWCSSCTEEIPHLRRVIAEWSDRGVVFLGALDPKDPMNDKVDITIEDYAKKSQLDFLDVALVEDRRAWRAYRTERLPAAVVIDRRGVIRWRGHPALFPTVLVNNTLAE